jgi:hypothetical protein
MIEKEHPAISIRRQSELLGISRSAVYYQPGKVRDEHDIEELQEILKVLEVIPFYGYRKVGSRAKKAGNHLDQKTCSANNAKIWPSGNSFLSQTFQKPGRSIRNIRISFLER